MGFSERPSDWETFVPALRFCSKQNVRTSKYRKSEDPNTTPSYLLDLAGEDIFHSHLDKLLIKDDSASKHFKGSTFEGKGYETRSIHL